MKALHFQQHGNIDQLSFGEIEDPKPQPDEVIVRVRASALNHLDLWVLRGWPGLKLPMPHIGGADIAGEIADCGNKVSDWRNGDRVVVNPGFVKGEDEWTRRGEESVSPLYRIFGEGRRGGFAEYVQVPAKNLMRIPNGFHFTQAAAPLLVGLTAWRMLKIRAQVVPNETVVIVGAGGGLNSFTVQLARLLQAQVIALTSTDEKMEKLQQLGAHHVINYRAYPEWSKEIMRLTDKRGADVIVDNVGTATYEQSLKAVTRGGRIVTVGNTSGAQVTIDNRFVFVKQISLIGSTMGSAKDFRDVMECVWNGELTPVVDSEVPLKQGKLAYKKLERGEQFGKVVLIPQ